MKIKTKINLKRAELFLTRKRYVKSYRNKKRLLIGVLIFINLFVWDNLIDNLKSEQNIKVTRVVVETVEVEEVVVEKSIEEKICETFSDNCDTMIKIAHAESGLNPETPPNGNSDGSTDTGIFRINSVHGYSIEYLTDVDNNISVAREVYDTQGITAWSAYNNGSYLKY